MTRINPRRNPADWLWTVLEVDGDYYVLSSKEGERRPWTERTVARVYSCGSEAETQDVADLLATAPELATVLLRLLDWERHDCERSRCGEKCPWPAAVTALVTAGILP
jgi:hypothetical protein